MSDIDEVKSRLNIIDIIGERVTLKKAGRNFKALCPFHDEKTPSFMVSSDRQVFHCFGCGKGGSVIDFVMEYEHIEFWEALEDLAARAGVKLERIAADTPAAKLKQQLYEINHLSSEFYHYLLTKHRLGEKARLYLGNRGITEKSIKTFMLGYSPNSWDGLLKFLLKKGYTQELMEKAGLIIRSSRSFYDRFRGRLMFTLKDHRGNVVGFSGRVLDPEIKEAKYINTSETPVYFKSNLLYGLDVTSQAIQKENEAILMEGEIDVISSFQAGISNVVAIKGSALTEGHVNLLRRFCERLTFALDSDVAGDAASRRGIEIAEKAGFDMRVVTLSSGKDPDEAARESPGLFKKAIKSAMPIYDYLLSSALKRFDVTTAFGKKKISDELLPVIAKIENSIVMGHYVRTLAKTLDITEEMISDGLHKVKSEINNPVYRRFSSVEDKKPASTRQEKLEMQLLALILQGKTLDFWHDFKKHIDLSCVTQPAVRSILEQLENNFGQKSNFSIKDFAQSLPSELMPTLDQAILWDMTDLVENDKLLTDVWQRSLGELQRLVLHQQIKQLTNQIKLTESEVNHQGLQVKLNHLTEKLKALEKSA